MSLKDELHAIGPYKARAAVKAEYETASGMPVDELNVQIAKRMSDYLGLTILSKTIDDKLRAAGHSEEFIAGAAIGVTLTIGTLISIAEVGEMPSLDQ